MSSHPFNTSSGDQFESGRADSTSAPQVRVYEYNGKAIEAGEPDIVDVVFGEEVYLEDQPPRGRLPEGFAWQKTQVPGTDDYEWVANPIERVLTEPLAVYETTSPPAPPGYIYVDTGIRRGRDHWIEWRLVRDASQN